jgi:hypothetical protein
VILDVANGQNLGNKQFPSIATVSTHNCSTNPLLYTLNHCFIVYVCYQQLILGGGGTVETLGQLYHHRHLSPLTVISEASENSWCIMTKQYNLQPLHYIYIWIVVVNRCSLWASTADKWKRKSGFRCLIACNDPAGLVWGTYIKTTAAKEIGSLLISCCRIFVSRWLPVWHNWCLQETTCS